MPQSAVPGSSPLQRHRPWAHSQRKEVVAHTVTSKRLVNEGVQALCHRAAQPLSALPRTEAPTPTKSTWVDLRVDFDLVLSLYLAASQPASRAPFLRAGP